MFTALWAAFLLCSFIYLSVCVHVCVCVHVHACVCMCVYMCVHVHMCAHARVCVHVCECVHASEDDLGSWFFLFTTWILRIALRSSGLGAEPLPAGLSWCPTTGLFLEFWDETSGKHSVNVYITRLPSYFVCS